MKRPGFSFEDRNKRKKFHINLQQRDEKNL